MLNQIDEDFPVLVPAFEGEMAELPEFIDGWRKVYPDFSPVESSDRNEINLSIVDFNLELQ